jgi:hypothetical protein
MSVVIKVDQLDYPVGQVLELSDRVMKEADTEVKFGKVTERFERQGDRCQVCILFRHPDCPTVLDCRPTSRQDKKYTYLAPTEKPE